MKSGERFRENSVNRKAYQDFYPLSHRSAGTRPAVAAVAHKRKFG